MDALRAAAELEAAGKVPREGADKPEISFWRTWDSFLFFGIDR